MKRRGKIVVGTAVVVAVGAVAVALLANRGPKGIEVRTSAVERKHLVSLVTASGTIQARTKVDLSANIMGQISSLRVKEGDTVSKGDLLLVIDPVRYSAAVESRRAALEALEAELLRTREAAAQARRDLDRAERQYEDEILPAAEYDRTKSQFEQQQASVLSVERQVSQARADLAAAKDELEKTEIRAPIDGIVTRRNVEQGEVVVTGTMNNPGTVLMTISDMSEIESVLEVDQTDVPLLAVGQHASVLIDAFPDRTFAGTVSDIGSSPIRESSLFGGEATGTDYEVKIALLEHPAGVRPGLTVTADITTAERDDVLTAPIGALVLRRLDEEKPPAGPENAEGDGKPADPTVIESVASRSADVEGIYVLEAGKAEFRPVTTGIKGELDVEITSGLEEGEEIVVGPFRALRELSPGVDVVVSREEPGGASP